MKLIKAIVRPNKVDEVKDALGKLSISGMTVTEVRGHGKQKGHTAVYRGKEYNVSLLPKMAVETVVSDGIVEEVIRAIIQAARTGEIGDGRVFVIPVEEAYRIRTGEKDPDLKNWCVAAAPIQGRVRENRFGIVCPLRVLPRELETDGRPSLETFEKPGVGNEHWNWNHGVSHAEPPASRRRHERPSFCPCTA